MTERKVRIVPEREIVARDLAYGSDSRYLKLQKILNKVVEKDYLNDGNFYNERPSHFRPPWDKQD